MDNQNKNLILATVLSFLVILVWYTVFAPSTPTVDPNAPEVATAPAEGGTPPAQPQDRPAVAAAAEAAPQAPRIAIDTPRLTGSLSLAGGRIDDLSLKDYKETLDPNSGLVRLLSPVGGTDPGEAQPYYAVYGWSPAGNLDGSAVPNARTLWTLDEGATLSPGQPVTLSWDNGAGLVFRRTISVDDNYLFTVAQSVENTGSAPVRLAPYGIVARHGLPASQHMWVLHEGVVGMTDGTLEEIAYGKMDDLPNVAREGGLAEVKDVATDGWIGFTDKYWMTALVPENGQAYTSVVKYIPGSEIYQTETRMPIMEVAPGATASIDTRLFAGAKEWETIRHYQNDVGIDRFVDSIDWGWFFFLTKPIFMLLHWLHGFIGNMGWSIILLTLIIKAIVFPLARKSYISMAKMKELQPEMEKLKERTGDDRAKFQQEMMALYKTNKVNPASGCLPIVLQIPIFFSLYKVIFVTLELRHAPWIGWIHDLSAPDPSSILNLFGLLPYATPDATSALHILSIGVLPILLGISMWLQQKLNPAPTDPAQAMIFTWMPWVFMFMLGRFASGLVLYWIANNTITFTQQYLIMTMHGHRPDIFGNIKSSLKRKKQEPAVEGKKK
ncbi:membrane protein insertase YidC [Frigidibacter sp. MR17.24]|uniref:membrane protein insertase YidC n=1 Tax=Frigidibacter sp. MR17.24 TaxID=3127345 RepID=UPI003012EA9D